MTRQMPSSIAVTSKPGAGAPPILGCCRAPVSSQVKTAVRMRGSRPTRSLPPPMMPAEPQACKSYALTLSVKNQTASAEHPE